MDNRSKFRLMVRTRWMKQSRLNVNKLEWLALKELVTISVTISWMELIELAVMEGVEIYIDHKLAKEYYEFVKRYGHEYQLLIGRQLPTLPASV